MGKRYLKKIKGVQDLVVVKNPPVYGKIPYMYAGTDWNIGNVWFSNTGADITTSADPFTDSTCIGKWKLDTDLTALVGTDGVVSGDVTVGYTPGVTGSRLSLNNIITPEPGYVDLGNISTGGTDTITVKYKVFIDRINNISATIVSLSGVDGPLTSAANVLCSLVNVGADTINGVPGTLNIVNANTDGTVNSIRITDSTPYLSKELNITQVISKTRIRTNIDGVWVGDVTPPSGKLFRYGACRLLMGGAIANSNVAGFSIQDVEVYNRILTDSEIRAINNSELFSPVSNDGLERSPGVFNPPGFMYLEQNGELLYIDVTDDGSYRHHDTTPKVGVITPSDNLAKVVNGDLVDRYGNPALPGGVRRVIQNTSNTLAVSADHNTWVTINTVVVDMDTSKYDYVIEASGVFVTSTDARANFNIRVGKEDLVTVGHVGFRDAGNILLGTGECGIPITVRTPKVTVGHVGRRTLSFNFTVFDTVSAGHTVSNINDTGANSGRQTTENKSDFIIYELFKE